MIYIQLFLSFLQVGALSFGGGYAAMPLIQEHLLARMIEKGLSSPERQQGIYFVEDLEQIKEILQKLF